VQVSPGSGRALARAALAGNPSDLYGGAVLAVTLPDWSAQATVEESGEPDTNRLVQAAVRRFAQTYEPAAAEVCVRSSSSIPRRVGLGSSSARVIAVTRALCERFAVALEPAQLAEFALAVETEELGIVAGLQDRVAQAFEGLTFMDFSGDGRYEPLDPGLLPPLVVAWREDAAGDSGSVHSGQNSLPVAEMAAAARGARDALLAGEGERFAASVDQSFDLRRRSMRLDPRCVAMVEAARAHGAAANYTGSGGAIVAVCADPGHAEAVAGRLRAVGASVAPPNAP
jgi:glucuronokinase